MKTSIIMAGCLMALALCSCKDNDPMGDNGRTLRTNCLLKNMKQQADKGYMFGHQDDPIYGVGWFGEADRSDVKSVCGDYPALMGFDLGHLELGDSLNLDGVPFDMMRRAIIEQYDRGGVVTLSWHVNNPLTGETAWVKPDSLTEQQKQTVASVLEGGQVHERFLGELDKVADFLNSLETEDGVKVPVIFRPWHEHSGSWFWWGRDLCSIEQYKALWKLTADRLKEKGVANVLYAYSPNSSYDLDTEKYMERYPGDEIIDILGLDYYCNAAEGDTTALKAFATSLDAQLTTIQYIAKDLGKVLALTETGYEGIPSDNWWTSVLAPVLSKHPVAYVLVWRNAYNIKGHHYAPYPGHRSADDFNVFYDDEHSLFLNDLH